MISFLNLTLKVNHLSFLSTTKEHWGQRPSNWKWPFPWQSKPSYCNGQERGQMSFIKGKCTPNWAAQITANCRACLAENRIDNEEKDVDCNWTVKVYVTSRCKDGDHLDGDDDDGHQLRLNSIGHNEWGRKVHKMMVRREDDGQRWLGCCWWCWRRKSRLSWSRMLNNF